MARGMVRRALGYKPGLEFCRDGAALIIFLGPGVIPLAGGGVMGSRRRGMLVCEDTMMLSAVEALDLRPRAILAC